ncbi:MAG TPA: hypothetical protein VGQ09_18885 [Chitinophagaceae bacterium]|nr:hypothetical protein [Chitinophagaceae bacterium]
MFDKKTIPYLKLIPIYIFLIVLQVAFASYFIFTKTTLRGKESPINISAYVFTILEYLIFATLLSKFIKLDFVKKYLIFSCIPFTVLSIIIWHSNNRYRTAMSIITTIESLSLIPFCLYYFVELLNNPRFLKLTDEPSFWITTGILFLFICITPFYAVFDLFKNIPEMQLIDFFGYDLLVLFLAKASFTKIKKTNG